MAIIKYITENNHEYLNIFPDQFKTEKEKKSNNWMKSTMDFFSNRAYGEYIRSKRTFVKNYDLMKGILKREDFYEEDEDVVKSFAEILTKDRDLPKYVKHYSIITTPVNELIGEMSKRPDTYRVKAFDDDSQSEELQWKTQLLQQFVISQAKMKIMQKAAIEGVELSDEELNEMTMEEVRDQLDSYTSVAEKWANRVLTCQKAEFNLKEKREEAFRDLCISARPFYLIYEDNSKIGFNIEQVNPKNAWFLTTPDKKWVSDVTGRGQGAYAGGTVQVMELSEIIEKFPELTKKEIDHLREGIEDYGLINARESNLENEKVKPGIESIKYDTYDPLVEQTRMILESEMNEEGEGIEELLKLTPNVSAFGYKYVVVRSYWISKKKIGKLTYIDEFDNEQTILVDEYYKAGTIPTELSLEWGWINQWYQGNKIGPDIYHVKPFKLLNYCPLIGMTYENKNTEAKSLVDMMKPFQVIYNICMNQLFDLLRKELGNVANINIRRIPRLKDGDDQDAIDMWESEARERGITFDDDSPENTKGNVSNTSIAKSIDLTRTTEIQTRYNLAVQMKNECWELVGMSKQRMGSISATETATGTNTAIQQSYSQTEPLFVAHEYITGQLYQAIIDASQYIESQKPVSTLSYITSEGESAFIRVNGSDLKFRDLKVFPTNRPEDVKMFNELRMLAQAVIQNGGSLYDIIELYSTNSLREMKKKFKDLRDRQIALEEEASRIEQMKLQQEREIAQAQLKAEDIKEREKMLNENYQNYLDRLNKKEVAMIQNMNKEKVSTLPSDEVEVSKIANEQAKAVREYNLKMAELQSKSAEITRKLDIEKEKLDVERERIKVDKENQKNDLEVARVNARGRSKEKQ